MNNVVVYAFIATLGTWFITALGAGVVVFIKNINEKTMNGLLGFSAGVMIASSFWSLLEPAIEEAEKTLGVYAFISVAAGVVFGAVFLLLSDKTVNFVRKYAVSKTKQPEGKLKRIVLLVLSITLHNIPEGLAVGVAFGVLKEGGGYEALTGAFSVALGIGLQNFPEGAAVSLPLRREGFSRKKSFLIGQASGMVEPVFGVIGALAVVKISSLLPFALSFAAGAMLLVAVHELIPECQQNRKEHPYFATMGIVFGFVVMMMLDVALG